MVTRDVRSSNVKLLEKAGPEILQALSDLGEPLGDQTTASSDQLEFTARLSLDGPKPDARSPYLSKFTGLATAELIDRDIAFFDEPTYSLSSCLVVFGSPTTEALMAAVQGTNCAFLFLVVDDIERFNGWIDTVDLDFVADRVRRHGGEVFFIPSDDPVTITGNVYSGLSGTAPAALDGLTLNAFGQAELARSVANSMGQLGFRALATLGTFYDQCLMLKNSEHNLRCDNARLYSNRTSLKPEMAAVIVGSGPSLDQDIPFLKEHQDKVVIISCGSALAPLLAAGIKPEFHIELENVNVGPTLLPAVRNHDISGITLVAPSTVDPVAMGWFDHIVFAFRPNLCNQPLYDLPASTQPILSEPTVVNLGLAFARERNFPEIIFIGTDLGIREASMSRDHAEGTWHTEDGSSYQLADHNIEVPANFGGVSYTTSGLYQALHVLSLAVSADTSGRQYINCSDGAKISGARAMRSGDMKTPPPKRSKSELVKDILDEFEAWDQKRCMDTWPGPALYAHIRDQITETQRDLRGIRDFADKAYVPRICMRYDFAEGHRYPAETGVRAPANMLVRGTVGSMILFMEWFLNRVTSPDDLPRVGEICVRLIDEALDDLLADAETRLNGEALTDVPEFEDMPQPPKPDFPPLPKLSRNAPCPCGSGQRFKNCHGKPPRLRAGGS